MKYIKTYEEEYKSNGDWIYFKIIFNKSSEKLKIGIEKTGYSDLFYKSYDVIDSGTKLDFIWLLFNINDDFKYSRCDMFTELSEFIDIFTNLEYKGEIHVEDYEVDSIKYNL